jgi:hypothetical protein
MFKKIADNRESNSLAVQYRRKRFAFFHSLLSRLPHPVSILDIGGTENYWNTMGIGEEDGIHITLLNLTAEEVRGPHLTSIVGDARRLEMEDSCFDVVFSNSVIEHVGSPDDQRRMAVEVRRVGQRYFVQTPNRYFPIEPHFLFPFYQFMPVSVRILLLQNFDLGWFKRERDAARARQIVEGIRLLDKRQFAGLFPEADIFEEKIGWLTKSFVAYGGWDES